MNKEKFNNELEQDEILEQVEIEVYAKQDKKPPRAKSYKIRIDKIKYDVKSESISGRGLLELTGKQPITNYRIDQKLRGGSTKKIELDEMVCLLTKGIERFMTLPLDQTEG
ncbi:MAG: multiubiquitin domain-containing protein [Clostridiales bacterium]|nr:multiubiquitin domain-containing protein [Clostridiales bacterium]